MNAPRGPDHRGNEVVLLWPASVRAVAAEKEYPELAEVWREIRARARARRPWEMQSRWLIFGCGPAIVALGIVTLWFSRDMNALFFIGSAVAVTGSSLWAVRRSGLMRVGELVSGMLEHGRCASCGYGIGGLDAEDDGCVVCPECEAAWRLSVRGK